MMQVLCFRQERTTRLWNFTSVNSFLSPLLKVSKTIISLPRCFLERWTRYTYLESRYFYCHLYEKRAKETKEFKELKAKIRQGYNLEILGYDGYPVTRSLQEHYEDGNRPFGHELVLFSLLIIDDPQNYPWNVFYAAHPRVYQKWDMPLV
jgi:hypothetical protein